MFNKPKSIEKQLAKANCRLTAALAALRPAWKGGELEERHAAGEEVLRLERELAEARKEPYAVPCDFPVEWDTGSPRPFLLCNESLTFLTFYVIDPGQYLDGKDEDVADVCFSEAETLCLVTFKNCISAKFGDPNVDVQSGHPLARRGFEHYTAQIIKNSPWIEEVAKTNSIHPNDDSKFWDSFKHYIFWFHDCTFECLTEAYEVEVTNESLSQLLSRVQTKLLENADEPCC